MRLDLISMTLEMLTTLKLDTSVIGALPVEPGGLPPDFIVDAAIVALRRGEPQQWCSFFIFVDPTLEKVVGSGGFRGAPENSRVEIGYGIAEGHRNQGYASDAVVQLVKIAFMDPSVHEVIAETSVSNGASRRVLRKANFVPEGQRESLSDGLVHLWAVTKPVLEAAVPTIGPV